MMVTPSSQHLQRLVVGGILAVSVALGAPAVAADPGAGDDMGDPANPLSPLDDVPMAPNDPGCIAEPGMGVCAGGPYDPFPGTTDPLPGTTDPLPWDDRAIPGMPGSQQSNSVEMP